MVQSFCHIQQSLDFERALISAKPLAATTLSTELLLPEVIQGINRLFALRGSDYAILPLQLPHEDSPQYYICELDPDNNITLFSRSDTGKLTQQCGTYTPQQIILNAAICFRNMYQKDAGTAEEEALDCLLISRIPPHTSAVIKPDISIIDTVTPTMLMEKFFLIPHSEELTYRHNWLLTVNNDSLRRGEHLYNPNVGALYQMELAKMSLVAETASFLRQDNLTTAPLSHNRRLLYFLCSLADLNHAVGVSIAEYGVNFQEFSQNFQAGFKVDEYGAPIPPPALPDTIFKKIYGETGEAIVKELIDSSQVFRTLARYIKIFFDADKIDKRSAVQNELLIDLGFRDYTGIESGHGKTFATLTRDLDNFLVMLNSKDYTEFGRGTDERAFVYSMTTLHVPLLRELFWNLQNSIGVVEPIISETLSTNQN